MPSLEAIPHQHQLSDDFDAHSRQILEGPPSSNYNFRQMQLVADWFFEENPDGVLTPQEMDRLFAEWTDDKTLNYSNTFRTIKNHPDFQEHFRFKGDVANITMDDIRYFIENDELPKY